MYILFIYLENLLNFKTIHYFYYYFMLFIHLHINCVILTLRNVKYLINLTQNIQITQSHYINIWIY